MMKDKHTDIATYRQNLLKGLFSETLKQKIYILGIARSAYIFIPLVSFYMKLDDEFCIKDRYQGLEDCHAIG